MKDELEKSFAFILELKKLKAVQRKVKPLGFERYENSNKNCPLSTIHYPLTFR